MIDKINKLYELIFNKFTFNVVEEKLRVSFPEGVGEAYRKTAKNFIKENKEFIINAVKGTKPNALILNFDIDHSHAPLSFAQERLWFVEKYEGRTNAFNVPMLFKLNDEVNLVVLEESVEVVIDRHEILRTLIKCTPEGKGYPYALEGKDVSFSFGEKKVATREELDSALKKESHHYFNLSHEIPIRAGIFLVSESTERYLSIVIHHIAFDGWSTDILLNELYIIYKNKLDNINGVEPKLSLSPVPVQYKDFAIWQKNYVSGDRLKEQENYWRDKLKAYNRLELATDYPRDNKLHYSGKDCHFSLDIELSANLRSLAKDLSVSLYSVMLSAYYLMLKTYSNQNDIVIGTPAANRHYQGVENTMGFFTNSLALRVKVDGGLSFKEFVQTVSEIVIEAQLNQDMPFEKLVEILVGNRDVTIHPIFQVIFGLQSYGNRSLAEEYKLLEPYYSSSVSYDIAKIDMCTYVDDSELCLTGYFNYSTALYSESTINSFINTYLDILGIISRNSELKIVEIASEMTRKNLLECIKWNDTRKNIQSDTTLTHLFERQVAQTPDAIAVMHDDKILTYDELNSLSNQLAYYLMELGVSTHSKVMIVVEPSLEMLIGLLGIMKAGGAYVPLEPSCPLARFQQILDDVQATVILTDLATEASIPATIAPLILLDEIAPILSDYSTANFETSTNGKDLFAVIYTSGTTGTPKGVLIEHRGVINSLLSQSDYAKFNSDGYEHFALLTSYIFDASISSLFQPLINGHRLVLSKPVSQIDVSAFLSANAITVLIIPSKMLGLLGEEVASLKTIIIGGESPDETLVDSYINDGITIIQEYGVTEASIVSVYRNCLVGDKTKIIGKPIANMKCFVLDQDCNVLPIGAIGELVLSGVGVSRGYLNDELLTKNKFIENRYQTANERKNNVNAMLYRTGDLVRWRITGELEYFGRNDHQIKIRGYRIEPGEVERAIAAFEGIVQNSVLSKEINNAHVLVCYYLSESALNSEGIKRLVQSRLPEYMVPHHYIHLAAFPLMENGKLDCAQLPLPSVSTNQCNNSEPSNTVEARSCQIWADSLGVEIEKIGIHDDFFELGGDSIISIQIASRLRQEFGRTVSVKDIFTNKTIANLCNNVLSQDLQEKNKSSLREEQGVLNGEVNLLPIQSWFFKNSFPDHNYYNQAFCIKTPALSLERLTMSVTKLQYLHDAFRLRYMKKDDVTVQYFTEINSIEPIKQLDVSTLGEEGSDIFNANMQAVLTGWQNHFNIETGPVYSIGYLYGYKDGSARIHVAMHHLLVDSVSWRILTEDLKICYEQQDIRRKGSSYRQWVGALDRYAALNDEEKYYWADTMRGYNAASLNSLVCEKGRVNNTQISFGEKKTETLLKCCNAAYNTEINDLLLTALSYALECLTNESTNHILLEGHGREDIDDSIDISQTVGWFTTMFPVVLDVKGSLAESLIATKENLKKVPNKGVGYGALFGYDSSILPKIAFNYLGQFNQNKFDDERGSTWGIIISDETGGISSSPKNQDSTLISINGLVSEKSLQFDISSKLCTESTRVLTEAFKENLNAIIELTESEKRTYLTGSDVDNIVTQPCLDILQHKNDLELVCLANSLQQGFIYHGLTRSPDDSSYHVQFVWNYHTNIDVCTLKNAWECAQRKYNCLRLRFSWSEKMLQIIDKNQTVDWRYLVLSGGDSLDKIKNQDREENFDLEKGNLFRIYLIKQKEELYTCIFSYHHSIFDGWSNGILLNYVHKTYCRLIDNKPADLSPDLSYSLSQKYIQKNKDSNRKYWLEYLSNIDERNEVTGWLNEKARNNNIKLSEYRHVTMPKEQVLVVEEEVYVGLKKLGKSEGLTLNAIVQYAWHKILSVYSNSPQTILGATVSGRNIPVADIESSVGLYINTLPVLFDHNSNGNLSIVDAIRNLQKNISDINSRSAVSLSDLQKSSARMFDNLFIFENYPVDNDDASNQRLKITFETVRELFDYPLVVVVCDLENSILITLKYAGEIIKDTSIERALGNFSFLLKQIVSEPCVTTKNISLLSPLDILKYSSIDDKIKKDCFEFETIHSQFESIVRNNPNEIAVRFEGEELSYRQLNERSNQLANFLLKKCEVSLEEPIACCFSRGVQILIALLASLKSGGCYVPISPNCPKDRASSLLKDVNTRIFLCDTLASAKLGIKTSQTYTIDDKHLQQILQQESTNNPPVSSRQSNLAYILYTSGSTGIPKGVMIEHKSYLSTVFSIRDLFFAIGKPISTFSMTDYVFDIFGLEYGLPLLTGGCLTMAGGEEEELNCSEFDFIQMTPSLCKLKIDSLSHTDNSRLFIGGESLEYTLLKKVIGRFSAITNFYGPTESTIWSTYKNYSEIKDVEVVTIGKPLPQESSYIFDKNLNLLPVGSIGELYLGGEGVARGYLNAPAITAAKFIENPLQKQKNTNDKLFKTGDLVERTENGELAFVGRNDAQIKLRGFRIELSEIECVTKNFEGVRQSAVLLKSMHGELALCCYYVSEVIIADESLKQYLQSKLPEYMVPQLFIRMESFPLTVRGKLDRKNFPEPKNITKTNCVAPRDALEKAVCQLLAEVLTIPSEEIGVTDDFYTLGGNSITTTILVSKINHLYHASLKISDLTVGRTVEAIANNLRNVKNNYETIVRLNHSPSKQALFMIHPGTGGCEVYQELAEELKGEFNCYGVDSYNLYNEDKKHNLRDLANYYLTHILRFYSESTDVDYNFLGWSLGGVIALEIASQLERRGVTRINVCLLDTVMFDNQLFELSSNIDVKDIEKQFRDFALLKGYDSVYTKKIVSNIENEAVLMKQSISTNLNHTNIILFKAMLRDSENSCEIDKFYQYASNLKYSNIENIVRGDSTIQLVKMSNSHHMNLLNSKKQLARKINSWHVSVQSHASANHSVETEAEIN